MSEIFQAAGFSNVETRPMEVELMTADTAAACWEMRVTGGPFGATFAGLTQEQQDAARSDTIRMLEALCPAGPVSLGAEALLTVGTNPA